MKGEGLETDAVIKGSLFASIAALTTRPTLWNAHKKVFLRAISKTEEEAAAVGGKRKRSGVSKSGTIAALTISLINKAFPLGDEDWRDDQLVQTKSEEIGDAVMKLLKLEAEDLEKEVILMLEE
jgi:hypothetical protein